MNVKIKPYVQVSTDNKTEVGPPLFDKIEKNIIDW